MKSLFGLVMLVAIVTLMATAMVSCVKEENKRLKRMHYHTWGPWSEPIVPFNSRVPIQWRTCTDTNCGEAMRRYL